MAQITPGSDYVVQAGDSLFLIAQQAYGDGNLWQVIFNANHDTTIANPDQIMPGWKLWIPAVQTCTVTAQSGLNIRSEANSTSELVASYPLGTELNYLEAVIGENVNGNPFWGHSKQNHYYWLGGTDHPNG